MEDKKLNIGFFIDVYYPMVDGVVMVVDQYAKIMSQFANVTVFAPKSREKTYKDEHPYPVIRSKQIKVPFTDYDLSLPFLDIKFKRYLKKADLDIVHIHSPFSMGNIGIKYAKKHKIPVVATLHSQYKKDFYERTHSNIITEVMLKEVMNVFNQTDLTIAVNDAIKEIFATYGLEKEPMVINNGTDLSYLEGDHHEEYIRHKYQIHPDEKIFLFVGRIDKVKNIFFIIDVLVYLKKHEMPFKMIFIGKGPQEEELKVDVRKKGLSDHVIFAGKIMNRVELSKFYVATDLFLFPSLYDSSSLVQIEAASQKTPTLFISGAATATTITPEVNGYVAENDPFKYALKIVEIFEHPILYKEVCENAFKQLYWTWDEIVEKVYQTYRNLIKNQDG
jgi:1,2-diacylglycerol 3-alpha-glucosyltransferase